MNTKSLLLGVGVGVLGLTSTLVAGVREPYVSDVGVGITQTQQTEAANRQALDQLSPAARLTVDRTIGNDQISSVRVETSTGTEAYRVELVRRPGTDASPTLVVSQDGTLVRESHMDNAARCILVPQSGAESNR